MSYRPGAPAGRAVTRPYVEPGVLSSGDFDRPVFEFDRRLRALERAFYRHVLRVIDLDALFDLEQRLWSRLQDHGPLTDEQVLDLSNAIVERAFERLGRDPIRAMKEGVIGPGGHIAPVPEEPHERCPFCDGEPDDGEPDDGEPDDGAGDGAGARPPCPPGPPEPPEPPEPATRFAGGEP